MKVTDEIPVKTPLRLRLLSSVLIAAGVYVSLETDEIGDESGNMGSDH